MGKKGEQCEGNIDRREEWLRDSCFWECAALPPAASAEWAAAGGVRPGGCCLSSGPSLRVLHPHAFTTFVNAAAAAAAKSLQSCPTLCDPIDGSPPGFPVPGILQARTLEWVAISFSNA